MKFTNTIKLKHNWLLRKIPNSNKFIVCENFFWYLDYAKKDYYINIEKGFQTDFWSIPKTLQVFFSPTEYISYILHDKLYADNTVYYIEKSNEFWNKKIIKTLTRKECDLILLEALNIEWASFFKKLFIYIWVRAWGWLFFKK